MPPADRSHAVDSPRAWFMWALGALAYVVAVMQRTSFGVASVQATERFSAGASLVSLFVVVQLLTYAVMQVPVGVLADRFGTRLVVAGGGALMCLGQLDLAVSTNVVSAIIARVLLGVGDAMTFGSVLRLLPAWFGAGRIAVLNQLTSMVGQAGQVLSSVPLAALLGAAGWTVAFTAAAAVSALTAVVVLALMRNAPPGVVPPVSPPDVGLRQQVANVLRVPASRLGFWIHWMCSFWVMTFTLMWGYPFLMSGLGYPQPVAAGLFTVMVLAGVPLGPLVGVLSRRAPLQRTNLALLVSLSVALPWLAVLLWPGPAPIWLLVVLMAGLAVAGPGSSVGFDVARAHNPLHQIGTASGLVIVGGFLAAVLNVWVIGVVLDLLGGYSPVAFRWAMATQFLFWGVGVAGAYVARGQVRRLDAARGVRHERLAVVLRREVANALVQWRLFRSPESAGPELGALELVVDDGRVVRVAALQPGIGGRLVAIDVPPPDAPASWWDDRVRDYLDLVATPDLEVGAIEVRCPDADSAAAARLAIAAALGARQVVLPVEVNSWARG
ncbi:MAG: MFS transporter [Propionicimonas sp.]